MFPKRLDFLVLFAGPEGLICSPSGFTFLPQPIEQRWIQGNCKAKGGDPSDCGENRLVQVQDYNMMFLHSFRGSLMHSQLLSHKREFLSYLSFLQKRSGGFLWCFFIVFFLKTSNHIPHCQTQRCPTSLRVSLMVTFFAVSFFGSKCKTVEF